MELANIYAELVDAPHASPSMLLPRDLLISIFSRFPVRLRLRCVSLVCKAWRRAVILSVTSLRDLQPANVLTDRAVISLFSALTLLDLHLLAPDALLPPLPLSLRALNVVFDALRAPLVKQIIAFKPSLTELSIGVSVLQPEVQALVGAYSMSLLTLSFSIDMRVRHEDENLHSYMTWLAVLQLPHLESLCLSWPQHPQVTLLGTAFSQLTHLSLGPNCDVGAPADLINLKSLALAFCPGGAVPPAWLTQVAPRLTSFSLSLIEELPPIPSSVLPYVTTLDLEFISQDVVLPLLVTCTKLRQLDGLDSEPYLPLSTSLFRRILLEMYTVLAVMNRWPVLSTLSLQDMSWDEDLPPLSRLQSLEFPSLTEIQWCLPSNQNVGQVLDAIEVLLAAAPVLKSLWLALPITVSRRNFTRLRELLLAAQWRGLERVWLHLVVSNRNPKPGELLDEGEGFANGVARMNADLSALRSELAGIILVWGS